MCCSDHVTICSFEWAVPCAGDDRVRFVQLRSMSMTLTLIAFISSYCSSRSRQFLTILYSPRFNLDRCFWFLTLTQISLIFQFSGLCIFTIILLKSVCRCSQTAGRNSCSIVLGDVSNCSYRLTLTSCHEFASQFDLAFFYMQKTLKTSGKPGRQCLFQ